MRTLHTVETAGAPHGAKKELERRSEPRRPVEEPAILHAMQPECRVGIPVFIVDASQNGVGIRTPLGLLPGSLVQIRIGPSVVLIGEVRHAVPSGDAFHTGVRIEDVADCRSIRSSLAKMWDRSSGSGTRV